MKLIAQRAMSVAQMMTSVAERVTAVAQRMKLVTQTLMSCSTWGDIHITKDGVPSSDDDVFS
jgi:hypothetical protein